MKITVIGLGKLGSCHAAVLAYKGHDVIGVDLNVQYVNDINEGRAPVIEPSLQSLVDQCSHRLRATSDAAEAVKQSSVTFVIVPTPSEESGRFSMKYALEAAKDIGLGLKNNPNYHIVVMSSTVMPGDVESKFIPALESASGKTLGKDFGVCYNPEFIALGNVVKNMLYPDMVLIGESDKKAGDIIQQIYEGSVENKPYFARMNIINAELTKISVNTYVTTKISYANMIGHVCSKLPNSDASVVLNAVGRDSRIGIKYLRAGLSFGGPCFPRDNIAFTKLAEDIGVNPILAKATDLANAYNTEFISTLIYEKLPKGAKSIGLLGLSYKANTPVIDVSPSIALARSLLSKGLKVYAFDPLAMENSKKEIPDLIYMPDIESTVQNADIVVIGTGYEEFKTIKTEHLKQGACIIDCCGILDQREWNNKIISLGVK